MPMAELSAESAAAQATSAFISVCRSSSTRAHRIYRPCQIALQAKDKGCELYPTSYAPPTLVPLPSTATRTAPRPQSVQCMCTGLVAFTLRLIYCPADLISSTGVRRAVSSRSDVGNARADKPVTIEERPVNASRAPSRSPAKQAVPSTCSLTKPSLVFHCSSLRPLLLEPINSVAAKRPPKGASLANPNKKARKYQELEFEDD
jgi:hypothetical protein